MTQQNYWGQLIERILYKSGKTKGELSEALGLSRQSRLTELLQGAQPRNETEMNAISEMASSLGIQIMDMNEEVQDRPSVNYDVEIARRDALIDAYKERLEDQKKQIAELQQYLANQRVVYAEGKGLGLKGIAGTQTKPKTKEVASSR